MPTAVRMTRASSKTEKPPAIRVPTEVVFMRGGDDAIREEAGRPARLSGEDRHRFRSIRRPFDEHWAAPAPEKSSPAPATQLEAARLIGRARENFKGKPAIREPSGCGRRAKGRAPGLSAEPDRLLLSKGRQ